MQNRELGGGVFAFLRAHVVALSVFSVLATLFLANVLFLDKSLGSFDIILKQPGWHSEFLLNRVHQPILLDSPTAHYPQRRFDWDSVKQGQNPNFNPYIFSGIPWGAQDVGAFLTSLPQLFFNVADAIDWSTWFRLILAGIFMYLLLMELGLGIAGSILGGVLWTYNLHQIVWLQFPQHLATQLWIPLLFLLNLLALRTRFRREYVVGAIVVNVLFYTSGYTQIVLYTYIFMGLFNTFWVFFVDQDRSGKERLKAWVLIHAIHICAFVFYGVGVVIEAQMISEGLRGTQYWRNPIESLMFEPSTVYDFLKSLVPPVEEVKRFYTPDYFGGIWTGHYHRPHGNVVEDAGYTGVLAVFLIIYAAITIRSATNWRFRITLFVLIALCFSLFYRNAVSISAISLIPFADKGNFGRFITLIIFFGSILAAFGFRSLVDKLDATGIRGQVFTLGAFVSLPFMSAILSEDFRWQPFIYPGLVIAAFAVIIVAAQRITVAKKLFAPAVIVIASVDLFSASIGFNTRLDNDLQFPASNGVRFLLNDTDTYRVAVVAESPMFQSNVLSAFRLPTIEGYSTVIPNQYVEFIKSTFNRTHIALNGMMLFLEPSIEVFRLLNVKYVLSNKDLKHEQLEKVLETNGHFIYRINNWLPRVYCATVVIPAAAMNAQDVKQAIKQYDRPAVVEEDVNITASECDISGLQVHTNNLSFNVHAGGDALVVLPYGFHDNWRVSIDNHAARIIKINHALMGFVVNRGASRVHVRYNNVWDTVDAVVIIIGAIVVLVLAFGFRGGMGKTALIVVSVLAIGKSALSLPVVRNDEIPERPALREPLRIEQRVAVCEQKVKPSTRIGRDQPFKTVLDISPHGLSRLQLLAATYHQASLPYTVTVALYDAKDELLTKQEVTGRRIWDNSWFQVQFPTIRGNGPLRLIVTSENDDDKKDFSLWLDKHDQPCITPWYDRAVVSSRESK
jgi:hypothetical protein